MPLTRGTVAAPSTGLPVSDAPRFRIPNFLGTYQASARASSGIGSVYLLSIFNSTLPSNLRVWVHRLTIHAIPQMSFGAVESGPDWNLVGISALGAGATPTPGRYQSAYPAPQATLRTGVVPTEAGNFFGEGVNVGWISSATPAATPPTSEMYPGTIELLTVDDILLLQNEGLSMRINTAVGNNWELASIITWSESQP